MMITLTPLNTMQAATDLLWSPVLRKFPDLKFALSEGGIGWLPYWLERIDYVYQQHRFWTHQDFGDKLPSQVAREPLHVLLHQTTAAGVENATAHRHRQHHVGVRLPALRLDVAALTRVGHQAARRRRPTTTSTRSRTRTRCGSSGTTRSRTGPRSSAPSARCAPRRPPSPSPAPAGAGARGRGRRRRASAPPAPPPRRSTIASPGCRSTMNRTTQSSHAFVCCITQLSQLISMARLSHPGV